jgi:hypothetical protein
MSANTAGTRLRAGRNRRKNPSRRIQATTPVSGTP